MKKNLNLIVLLGSLFLAVLVFAFMALPGVTISIFGATGKASVYDCLEEGGVTAAFILFIIGFLAGACACVIKLLNVKFKYGFLVAFCGALLLLVAGILFFCTSTFVGGDLGIGAILCGILAILASFGLCFYGAIEGQLIKL